MKGLLCVLALLVCAMTVPAAASVEELPVAVVAPESQAVPQQDALLQVSEEQQDETEETELDEAGDEDEEEVTEEEGEAEAETKEEKEEEVEAGEEQDEEETAFLEEQSSDSRLTVAPALTEAGALDALHAIDSELEEAEDALNEAVDADASDSDSMRFATASAESRAAAMQSLQTITSLASAQVEKAQQMMAVVAHNKDMLNEEMAAEFSEKASDALEAGMEALSASNSKLESVKLLEANSAAVSAEGAVSAAAASAPLPPPVPSASVSADSAADAEDSDQMPAADSAVLSAEQEQAPSHLVEASPTLREMSFSQQHETPAPAPARAPAPAPAPVSPAAPESPAPAPAPAPAAPAAPAAPSPAPAKDQTVRSRLCSKCKSGKRGRRCRRRYCTPKPSRPAQGKKCEKCAKGAKGKKCRRLNRKNKCKSLKPKPPAQGKKCKKCAKGAKGKKCRRLNRKNKCKQPKAPAKGKKQKKAKKAKNSKKTKKSKKSQKSKKSKEQKGSGSGAIAASATAPKAQAQAKAESAQGPAKSPAAAESKSVVPGVASPPRSGSGSGSGSAPSPGSPVPPKSGVGAPKKAKRSRGKGKRAVKPKPPAKGKSRSRKGLKKQKKSVKRAAKKQKQEKKAWKNLSKSERKRRRACIKKCPREGVAGKDCRQKCRGKIVCVRGPKGRKCRARRRALRKLQAKLAAAAKAAAATAQPKTVQNAAAQMSAPAGAEPATPGVTPRGTVSAPVRSMGDIQASIEKLTLEEKQSMEDLRDIKSLLKQHQKKIRVLAERQHDDRNWWKADRSSMEPLTSSRNEPVPPPKEDVRPPVQSGPGALSASRPSASSEVKPPPKPNVMPPPSMAKDSAKGKGGKNLKSVLKKQRKLLKKNKKSNKSKKQKKKAKKQKKNKKAVGPGAGVSRKQRKLKKLSKTERKKRLDALKQASKKYRNSPRGPNGFPLPAVQAKKQARKNKGKGKKGKGLKKGKKSKKGKGKKGKGLNKGKKSKKGKGEKGKGKKGKGKKGKGLKGKKGRKNLKGRKNRKNRKPRPAAGGESLAQRRARKAKARRARGGPARKSAEFRVRKNFSLPDCKSRCRRGRRGRRCRRRCNRLAARRQRFVQTELSAEEQARRAVVQAQPHTYVEHAEHESVSAPILSTAGKPLFAPRMVDGYEVAVLRSHAVDASEENMMETPTAAVLLMESEEVSANPEPDRTLVAPKIEDPKKKRANRYTQKRCKGKKCVAYIAPRYAVNKNEKPKLPTVYMTPAFAVPKVDSGVVVHLRGPKPKPKNAAAHLSMAHVMTPNEEYMRAQELAGGEVIAPEYVASRRALKKFFNPEAAAALKAAKAKAKAARAAAQRALGSILTPGMHSMLGEQVQVPEWAPARKPHPVHNHVGVWSPAKIVAGTRAPVFLEVEEAEEEAVEDEEQEEEEASEEEEEDESEEEEEEEEQTDESEDESESESEEEEEEDSEESEESEAEEETGAAAFRFAEKPKGSKAKKAKHTIEAAYRPPFVKQTQFQAVEYGDPNAALTAAQNAAAAKAGKPVRPTVFTSSYFSPMPQPNPWVKCFGAGDATKCYAVDKRTGAVIGRDDPTKPFALLYGASGRTAVQTPIAHHMEANGFVEPAYDDKLALWKPKKTKRTLVPAPMISFAEVHFEAAARDAQAEAEAEASPAKAVPDRPTTKLTFKPVIIAKGKPQFFAVGHRLPQFYNSKIEDVATQQQKMANYQLAAVHPPEFFKPQDPAKKAALPRFVAADSLELSAAPTVDSLPALNLESEEQDEANAKDLYSEVKALLASKAVRA